MAFGGPGIEPRWSHANKDGVGTAYSADSRLWYTLWRGTVTEVYYPRIDRPQLRDLEFLFTDGGTLFHEEKRQLVATTERSHDHALGFTVRSEAPEGRYRLTKWVIGDPHQPCLLVRARLEILDRRLVGKLRLFALVAPHLEVGGWGNHATVYNVLGRSLLAAEKGGTALAVGCSSPFVRTSVGYVGTSDGWTDISQHGSMAWEFDRAPDGNVALTGEIPIEEVSEFTLGLAFGDSIQSAATTLYQSLTTPFELHQRRFLEQWNRTTTHQLPLSGASHDRGKLYRSSCATLLAHEDKLFPGAFIASLSIPWGSSRTDVDRGGYHLVWTRDLAHSAMGLLASGSEETAVRALVYLATQQRADGGFPQNFWVRRDPVLAGDPARRGRAPAPARREAQGVADPAAVRSGADGAEGRAVPDRERPGDPAGSLGGGQRLLPLDPRDEHRGADGRRRVRPRPGRRGHGRVRPGVRGFPRRARGAMDR